VCSFATSLPATFTPQLRSHASPHAALRALARADCPSPGFPNPSSAVASSCLLRSTKSVALGVARGRSGRPTVGLHGSAILVISNLRLIWAVDPACRPLLARRHEPDILEDLPNGHRQSLHGSAAYRARTSTSPSCGWFDAICRSSYTVMVHKGGTGTPADTVRCNLARRGIGLHVAAS
jgi:hypothetical protein